MMGGYWDDDDEGGYSDPEDEAEAEAAAARPRKKITAHGESVVPEGEAGIDLISNLARTHAELAIETLAYVAANGVKDAARVSAANSLLARGFGMPTRKTEQKVDVKISDQRAAHFSALQELAERNPTVFIQDAEFEEIEPRQIRKRGDDDD